MKKTGNIVTYLILIAYTVIAIFPLYWLVTTSFKEPLQVFSVDPIGFFKPTLENYKTLFFNNAFPRYLLNSMLISLVAIAITLPVGACAGYVFARLPVPKKDTWFMTILSTRMAPPVAFAVPIYLLIVRLGLIDSHTGLIAVYVFMNLAFCTWMTKGFFEEVPPEIEEAALVDGCTPFGAFLKVAIPLTKGGLIATAILMFIFTWNEFFFASILTQNAAKTFTVHLTSFFGSRRILWGELAAASTIGSIIPIIFAVLTRHYMVRGLTMGMIKEN
jgi:multiple sugar transport system permease protein